MSKLPVDARWHESGPSLRFFPFPVIDPERPWGGPCEACPGNLCTGHYVTDVNTLVRLHEQGKAIRALPPSAIISEALSGREALPDDQTVNVAKKCCLSVEDVKCWVDHILNTRENRKRGALRAKETRARRKKQAS